METIGVRGNLVNFQGSNEQKRLRTTAPKRDVIYALVLDPINIDKHILHFGSRWKWSIKQPIIAGRKKRSAKAEKDMEGKLFAELLEKAYVDIIRKLEEKERKREEYNFVENE